MSNVKSWQPRRHLLRCENRSHPEHFSEIECSKLMDSRHELSAEQVRLARALLKWSRVRLASKANLSEATISGIENGLKNTRPSSVLAVRLALEAGGIVFAPDGRASIVDPKGQITADNRTWRRRMADRSLTRDRSEVRSQMRAVALKKNPPT
ncbi:helix-turn-helix transcriptional regulator [Mesorhizobium sp.]|uniref:helix-turn-helix domain-containing protein n=2 Tax=Mesorhizobium TaxID=68287 RepID=UPI003427FE27